MIAVIGRILLVGLGAMVVALAIGLLVSAIFPSLKHSVWGSIVGALIGAASVNAGLLLFANWIADAE